jgi:all-trans-8'-apo-beta-carotenal 15,15'-oxygenase
MLHCSSGNLAARATARAGGRLAGAAAPSASALARARGRRGADAPPPRAASTETATTATTPPCRATPQVVADMKAAFLSQLEEFSYDLEPSTMIDGAIPPELAGTYFRNGPALQVAGRHTFDGDGYAISICFPGQGQPPRFRSAYVRTAGFLEEQAAGKPTLRTAFTRGAPQGGFANPLELLDFDRLKNVSNTGLLQWGGRLLSLYESHRPHELRPGDLSTVGEVDLGGQLKTARLAAHYRVMGGSGGGGGEEGDPRRWVAFSANSGPAGSTMVFYEFLGDDEASEDKGAASRSSSRSSSSPSSYSPELVRSPTEYALAGSPVALVHDIAVTRDFYVVYESPLEFNVKKFAWEYLLRQRTSVAECLEFARDKPARVHFIPRPGGQAAGQPARVAEAPARFCFHHANAFQVEVVEEQEGLKAGLGFAGGVASSSSSSSSSSSGGGGGGAERGAAGRQRRVRVAVDAALWDDVSFELTQYTLTPEYYDGGSRSQLRRLVFDLGPADASSAEGSAILAPPSSSSSSPSSSSSSSSTSALPARLVSDTNLLRRAAEFPSVDWRQHGKPARCIYASVDAVDDARFWGPAQAVAKVVVPSTLGLRSSPSSSGVGSKDAGPARATAEGVVADVWEPGPRYIVGEPLFVPRRRQQRKGADDNHNKDAANAADANANANAADDDEDDGFVIVALQNAETGLGEVAILDSRKGLGHGPVARLRLPHYLPSGLHGSFSAGELSSLSAPQGPARRRIRDYDAPSAR